MIMGKSLQNVACKSAILNLWAAELRGATKGIKRDPKKKKKI